MNVDRSMLAIGVFLMLISSYQLFVRKTFSSGKRVLGELVRTQSVVKVKEAQGLDWHDGHQGLDVYEDQLIYTTESSGADVSFSGGEELHIGESSLVKISARGKTASLGVERGIVRAKLTGEDLTLKLNGRELKLSGTEAEVQIDLQKDSAAIGVISGAVQVASGNETEKVSTDSVLKVSESELKTEKIHFTLQLPRRGQTFYYDGEKAPVQFAWAPDTAATLVLARDSLFTNSKKFQLHSGASIDLSQGNYYWKLEGDAGGSLSGDFKVRKEVAPELIRPAMAEIIELPFSSTLEATFLWAGEKDLKYLLEFEGPTGTSSQVIGGTRTVLDLKIPGDYKWRARVQEESRTLARWSEWQKFSVRQLAIPLVPANVWPDRAELQVYEESIELKWTSDVPVVLELRGADNKTQVVHADGNSHLLKAPKPGAYRWRLQAKDKLGQRSDWTEWKTFEVLDMSDEDLKGAQKVLLKRPDQLVKFEWEGGPEASVFELSRDKAFKDVILKKTIRTDRVETVVPTAGTFYWRSRQGDEASRPKRVIIEQAPPPVKPERLPDQDVPINWRPVKKSTWWRILDFIIGKAHADDPYGVVKVDLPFREEDKAIAIRIFADPELKKLLLEEKITQSTFVWKKARPGKYFIQYAIIDHWDRQGPFSDPAILSVSGKFHLALRAPKLLSPIKAQEVLENSEIGFQWTDVPDAKSYELEISDSKLFERVLVQQSHDRSPGKVAAKLKPGHYFWRVRVRDEGGAVAESNSGRFTVIPLTEPIPWEKIWRPRASVAWAPSIDEYTFKSGGKSGTIDGQTLNGIEIKGSHIFEKWIAGVEFLRQSGKVFKSEPYQFTRLMFEGSRRIMLGGGHLLSGGAALTALMAQEYEIEGSSVKGSDLSTFGFGPVVRGYHPISPTWEIQSRLLFLLGGLKQMEGGVDLLRYCREGQYLLGGISYATRTYDQSSGSQSSIRFSFGVGKEF